MDTDCWDVSDFLPCENIHVCFFVIVQIRLVVEEGLNQLPYNDTVVTTPTGISAHIKPILSRWKVDFKHYFYFLHEILIS